MSQVFRIYFSSVMLAFCLGCSEGNVPAFEISQGSDQTVVNQVEDPANEVEIIQGGSNLEFGGSGLSDEESPEDASDDPSASPSEETTEDSSADPLPEETVTPLPVTTLPVNRTPTCQIKIGDGSAAAVRGFAVATEKTPITVTAVATLSLEIFINDESIHRENTITQDPFVRVYNILPPGINPTSSTTSTGSFIDPRARWAVDSVRPTSSGLSTVTSSTNPTGTVRNTARTVKVVVDGNGPSNQCLIEID